MRPLLHLFLRFYPRPFRDEFGAHVVDVAVRDYQRARQRGRATAFVSLLGSVGNIIGSATAERVKPTWRVAPVPNPGRGSKMQMTFEHWRRDLTHAVRSLRRAPSFTAVTTLTLALAIGTGAAMFSVVNAVLINPLPYAHTDRLMYLSASAPGSQYPAEFGLSTEFYVHYRQQSQLLEDIALFNSFTNTFRIGDRAERIRMSGPTYSLFSTLGAVPLLGRLPTEADQDRVAIASYALWQDWFGGDRGVIGRTFQYGNQTREIIGVMAPDFRFPADGTLLWLSGVPSPTNITPGQFGNEAVARAKPGVTPEQLATELTALAKQLPARFGGPASYARTIEQLHTNARPLTEQMLGASARPLGVLFAASLIVLVIACANVANLIMIRAEGRRREMAVRQAIGAGRGQLIRVQLSESVVIAAIAAVLAIAIAWLLLPLGISLAPPNVPRLADAGINFKTTLFTVAAALIAALACGLVPAFRSASPSLLRLRDGSRGATSRRRWGRDALVAAQTALALVLLIGSALLLRSHAALSRVDPGYRTDDLFTFQIAPEQRSLKDGPSYARFIMNFTDRLRALPSVESVGVVENVPLDESTASGRVRTEGVAADAGTRIGYTFSGEDYFSSMGIRVLEGRAYTRADAISSLGNVVVSKTAAKMLWPNESAVGKRLQLEGLPTWETVIGVVNDVMQDNYRTPAQPVIYLPLTGQQPQLYRLGSPGYVVKTKNAETIAPQIRALVREIAPEAPMYRTYTMAFLADRQMRDLSFTMLTLGVVSALALILGVVGLYGALSYVVAERTREIGVRMALGAHPSRVRWMVVGQGAQLAVAGVVVGLLVARFTAGALDKLVFGVSAIDVMTFAVVSGSMLVIGLLASYLPARRASNVDPLVSLRGE